MCDFAVGLSRQLHGLTIASERPRHRMIEQWHPLGPIGIITAFNFPVAVWAWNAMIAAVCGDTMIWKPSPERRSTAIAVQRIVDQVAAEQRLPGRVQSLRRRRRRDRRANGRGPPAAADLGDRKLPDGPPGCRGGGQAAGPDDSSSSAATTRIIVTPMRRPRAGCPRHGVRGRRHGRPAVHDRPPPVRPRVDPRRRSSTGSSRSTAACRSATRGKTACWWAR